jgi:hypothetical protein
MSTAAPATSSITSRSEPSWRTIQSTTVRWFSRAHAQAQRKPKKRKQLRAGKVVSSGAGLLAVAVRLLPAADRAQYAQEYLCELWELAQSGVGRRGQLRYALRQLLRVLPMGFALRSPRRRSAVP